MAEFYKKMYECDDALVSSKSETLNLNVADDEIRKKIESPIQCLKCGKAARVNGVTVVMNKYDGPRVLELFWFLCKAGNQGRFQTKGKHINTASRWFSSLITFDSKV